ncbi:High affinity cAMP-specific 3',5'-cyclic phosphodiesterase 7A [Cichlidogyrus casuarinus]|uniref:High affinity cAMP-specific 3',5'-cyclic phosphodiesterase 7A n=1 Tax=Cichlidogyrus casuarinus TaxID=1844966 RepID=A0ABD2PK11_9PLAT
MSDYYVKAIIKHSIIKGLVSDLDVLTSLLAALCHDVDHPGVNQAFLEKNKSYLADLYNCESVLENHHYRFGLGILKENKILNNLKPEEWNHFKKSFKQIILSTDISRQAIYLEAFQKMTWVHSSLEYATSKLERFPAEDTIVIQQVR